VLAIWLLNGDGQLAAHARSPPVERRGHLALVVDEFGASAGIVTLQDVIAEVLGPLPDEFGLERQEFSA
jgi:Mg2+/Co2+ transporter CorC